MGVLHYGEQPVSVAMNEIPANEWADKGYRPDIVLQPNQLYKKPAA